MRNFLARNNLEIVIRDVLRVRFVPVEIFQFGSGDANTSMPIIISADKQCRHINRQADAVC